MTNFEKVGLFMKTFGQELKTNSGLSSEPFHPHYAPVFERDVWN